MYKYYSPFNFFLQYSTEWRLEKNVKLI
jgi:hypothetical protein